MSPINIGAGPELFVDKYLIDQMQDLRLALKHPERREAFVFDAPWEGPAAIPRSVVVDEGTVRLYYRASIPDMENSAQTKIMALAESRDGGISFERPNLGLYEFDGAQENNIIGRGLPGAPPAFIDTNPDCREDQRYKGLNSTWGQLYALGSPDGIHWRRLQEAPLDYPGAFDTVNTAFWDCQKGCYRSYTRAWVNRESRTGANRVRIIQSATSPDFIHWDHPVANEYADGEDDVQLYTNATSPCPGAEHIYVAFPNRFMECRWVQRGDAGRPEVPGCNDALFMASRDGIHWTRYRDAWVRPGLDDRNWGQRNNYPVWGIVPTSETEWSMYVSEHYMQPDVPGRMRRLSIRPHGFVSMHADYSGGEFTTRPLVFDGRCLRLNYSTSAAGHIRVELQDAEGKPLEGFALEDMAPLFGDALDGGVTWEDGNDLRDLAGQPIRIRFQMKDADLFALRFSSSKLHVSRGRLVEAEEPTYRTEATCSEIRVPRVTDSVHVDGDLEEWNLSAAVPLTPPDRFKDSCNARIAMMYDARALYVGGDVADPYPMVNTTSFDSDMRDSWNSDALQIHLGRIADHPAEGDHSEVNDIRLWYSTRDGQAGCCIIPGKNADAARLNPDGVEGTFQVREDGKGYVFEYRLPWTALNCDRAPRVEEELTACIQCHWGTQDGDDLMCGAVDVRSDSQREAHDRRSWGKAVFE